MIAFALGLFLFQNGPSIPIQPAAQATHTSAQTQATPTIFPNAGNADRLHHNGKPECSPETPCIVKVVESPKRTAFDYILFGVSIALGAVGIAGIWVGISTLRKIERQTAATEKQAEHLVNAERPWVLVKYSGSLGGGFTFWAENSGKSPAKIIWLDPFIPAQMVPVGERLPTPPQYGFGFAERAILTSPIWIAPSSRQEIGVFDSFTAWPGFDPALGGYSGGSERLFIYSAIRYCNTFDDREHETHFCYRLGSGVLHLDGPPGYNECT